MKYSILVLSLLLSNSTYCAQSLLSCPRKNQILSTFVTFSKESQARDIIALVDRFSQENPGEEQQAVGMKLYWCIEKCLSNRNALDSWTKTASKILIDMPQDLERSINIVYPFEINENADVTLEVVSLKNGTVLHSALLPISILQKYKYLFN